MTTVVSNGYYLASDHRGTDTIVRDDIEYKRTDIRNGKQITATIYDDMVKTFIMPPDIRIMLNGNVIRAVAVSGVLACFGKVMRCIRKIKPNGMQLDDLIEVLKYVPNKDSDKFTMVAVDSGYNSSVIKFDKVSVRRGTYDPGVLVYTGSGMTSLEFYDKVIKDLKVPEAMIIANAYDIHTSPTYSVFGMRENMFYTNIDIPKQEREEMFKDLQRRAMEYESNLSPYKPAILRSKEREEWHS